MNTIIFKTQLVLFYMTQGSIAINTGNNIQSLGMKTTKKVSVTRIDGCDDNQNQEDHKKASFFLRHKKNRTAPIDIDIRKKISYLDHNQMRERNSKSKTWILGTVIFVLGSLLNFSSYTFAAQSRFLPFRELQ